MRKKDDDSTVPVPVLTLDPPSEAVTTLPGPQAESTGEPTAEEPKRRRRRKSKPEPEPTPEGVASPEDLARCEQALAMTFAIGSKIVAKKRGPHWILDKEESETLGAVWTSALAPYLPKVGAAVPWAAAAVVTWTMIQPRMARDVELVEETPPGGPVLA